MIAKKIPGKTDKQVMYKITSMQNKTNYVKKMNFANVKDMHNSKNSEYTVNAMYDPEKADGEDREIERLPSGEQYKYMVNSQSGSSSVSASSHHPKGNKEHGIRDKLDIIEEESRFGDGSLHESDYFKI